MVYNLWIQTLSEKVQKSLQIIVNYTPVPLPKKVLGSIGHHGPRKVRCGGNLEWFISMENLMDDLEVAIPFRETSPCHLGAFDACTGAAGFTRLAL